ncbi:T9SS type A sorting domain-containing protein [Flavivirga aquimarina]|uniref:T9SS type A sorting domain-containing protein n=1 Tax=Flavivirga aquimarina TaxID=2027862 RepID=A0ABT8W708_9FLAO|nr:T9SS type A sorting domain-containing protein [Flavivirga aquimarina]MDO5968857.1 T9SS type A sorting domain-containing protein [Flavivirga aquimarina]
MKKKYLVIAISFVIGIIQSLQAQILASHDFNNGGLGDFLVCTTQSPNYASVVNNRLKTFWQESSYNGTRTTKGAEVCANNWNTRKEGWMGFTMNLGPDYPTNKTAGVAQIFQFYSSTFWSWAALINIINGDLQITHRSNGGTSGNTNAVIYPNFPKNTNMDIIIHFVLSASNNGLIQIWVNGVSEYYANNINFGYAEGWTNDVQSSQYSYVDLKIGQYNYDDPNYTNNETRTVYYDNVSWYSGSNGYSIVNPSAASGNNFRLVKRNSTGFAIDGGSGGANGQSIELYTNINHNNLRWIEIDRGGGYYSYQKYGTNYCIDGGNNGANGQDVYLWECGNNNQNQHWLKINAGNGHYRLQKRNAPSYSIDGGNQGAINQNVYLWTSSSTNQNQQWRFDTVSTSKNSGEKLSTEETDENIDDFNVFPSPVNNELTIKLNDAYSKDAVIEIYSVNGQKVIQTKPSSNLVKLDLSKLYSGIYVLMINSKSKKLTKKIVKL